MCSRSAALPPPSVVADAITADSMSFSFSFNSQYEVAEPPPPSRHPVPIPHLPSGELISGLLLR